MKSYLLTALVLSAAPALAQQSVLTDPKVAALRDAALKDDLAYALVEGLTTEIGPRLAGSPAERRARDWAVAKLRALGFSNVRIETFPLKAWSRDLTTESASIVDPFPQHLAVTALGGSASTPRGGIEGSVVGFDSIEQFEQAPDAFVRGKIVFVDHAMPRTQDGSSYGAFIGPRSRGPSIASRKGAIALLIRSIGTDHHRNPHTGMMRFDEDLTPIPAGALSLPDADQLKRILARGQPVRLRLNLINAFEDSQSGNVIAEVPGRDAAAPPVLVSCHLDSWDLGTGAIDDAAGCGIVTAAAKRIMDAGRPLRPIRVVWFGSEEQGLIGGEDYLTKHGKEPHWAIAESDFGADRVWRVTSKLGKAREAEAKALQAALTPLGIVPGSTEEADGSDIGPLLESGVPGVALSQDGTHYFDLHHTPDDTLDKIDPAQLRQNVAAWTAMLAVMSGGIEPGPKPRKRR